MARTLRDLGVTRMFVLTGGEDLVEMFAHNLHTEPEPIADRLVRPVAGDLEAVVMPSLVKLPEDPPVQIARRTHPPRWCPLPDRWEG